MGKKSSLIFILGLIFSTYASANTKPTFPGYANCPVTNGVINATCISDVNYTYNAALAAYNKAAGLVTDSYTGTVTPIPPTYSCSKKSDGTYDNVCENAYAAQAQTYNNNLNSYSAIQQQNLETAQLQANAQQARIAAVAAKTSTSTTASLASSIEQNKSGSVIYKVLAGTLGTLAVISAAQHNYLKAGMYAAAAGLALSQVKSHNKSASAACVSLNQLSTTATNCADSTTTDTYTSMTPAGQITAIVDQIDPSTGKCKVSAPASCVTDIETAKEHGVDVRALVTAANQFAGANAPLKFNADGSVTTKDGKTFKPSDLADEASMIAAGISPSDAKAFSSELHGPDGLLVKAGLDAKGELKDLAKTDSGSFAAMSSGGGSSGSGEANTSGITALGTKDLSAGKRKPSSSDQGLIRSFNGDSIGIANDDIFKMMNKRYKLKSAQDAFIGP